MGKIRVVISTPRSAAPYQQDPSADAESSQAHKPRAKERLRTQISTLTTQLGATETLLKGSNERLTVAHARLETLRIQLADATEEISRLKQESAEKDATLLTAEHRASQRIAQIEEVVASKEETIQSLRLELEYTVKPIVHSPMQSGPDFISIENTASPPLSKPLEGENGRYFKMLRPRK